MKKISLLRERRMVTQVSSVARDQQRSDQDDSGKPSISEEDDK